MVSFNPELVKYLFSKIPFELLNFLYFLNNASIVVIRINAIKEKS